MSLGTPFDRLAGDYDAARPRYPPELFDAVAALSAVDWAGAHVVDVGAGTGIASREMLRRGARVLAVDRSPGMLALARAAHPAPMSVLGEGERLPVWAGWADLVTYAQAWHWVDVGPAAAAAARILRPGGALAVWWNDVDARDTDWWLAQQQRIEAMNPDYTREYRDEDYGTGLLRTSAFDSVAEWVGRWSRDIDLDTYERWLRSKSYVAAIGPRLEEFLAAERASLAAAFPDGVVREPFRVRLWVARTAPDRG